MERKVTETGSLILSLSEKELNSAVKLYLHEATTIAFSKIDRGILFVSSDESSNNCITRCEFVIENYT